MKNRLTKFLKFTDELDINRFELSLLIIIGISCFFIFLHGDIMLTGRSSILYLDGHILDFYEIDNAAYPPATYILFAIWNIPLKLFGIIKDYNHYSKWAPLWWKLLPVIFFIASGWVIKAIGIASGLHKKEATAVSLLWLTHPIAFFSPMIFGQYDSITVFISLLGLLYILKSQLLWASIYFGLAICFKPFPAFIFLILLVLTQKNIFKIVGYGILSLVPYVLLVLPYMNSGGFKSHVVGFVLYQRLLSISLPIMVPNSVSLFVLGMTFLVGLAYYKNLESEEDRNQWPIFFALVTYTFFFSSVQWHPQWLIHITPFMVLMAYRYRNTAAFMIADFLLMLFFVGYTVCFWKYRVDQDLIYQGALSISGLLNIINPDFATYHRSTTPNMALFFFDKNKILLSAFYGIFLLYPVMAYPRRGQLLENDGSAGLITKNRILFWIRFLLGTGFFIIPAMIALFAGHQMYRIDPALVNANPKNTEQFVVDDNLKQYFKALDPTISLLYIHFALSGNTNGGVYELSISDPDDNVIYKRNFSLTDIKGNPIAKFPIPSKIKLIKGNIYSFNIRAIQTPPGSKLSVYYTKQKVDQNLYVTRNGVKLKWNLHFGIDP